MKEADNLASRQSTRHLMVTEWYTTSKLKKVHGIDFVGIIFPVRGNQISYQ